MDTRPEHLISENFRSAFDDYLFLLKKRYPQKIILKMVGDRYALSGIQRSMLYRGVTTAEINQARARKQAMGNIPGGSTLFIDAFNVIITIGSYLSGRVVYISTDSMLRDATELHGEFFNTGILDRTLDLMVTYLKACAFSSIHFYCDEQVSSCGIVYDKVMQEISSAGMTGSASVETHVDKILSDSPASSLIASSDSTIMDRTHARVLDLPYSVLNQNFQPVLIDLRSLLPEN